MSKTGIAVAAIFLGLALFSGARGIFASDEVVTPPPSPVTTPDPTPTPTPTPTELEPFPTFEGPRPKPVSYDSTEELAAALEERGIECTFLDYLDQPDPTLEEFSLCDPGPAERRLNIYFFTGPANRRIWTTSLREQKVPQPVVIGPNWIVVGSGEPTTAMKRIKSVAGAIGGRVRDFSPKKKA